MGAAKNIKIKYTDGTSDIFDEKDNPEYEGRHGIFEKDWLRYTYTNGGAILQLDTRRTCIIIPMSSVKKVHIEEKE